MRWDSHGEVVEVQRWNQDTKKYTHIVRAYLVLKAHDRHNKPPSAMLATTAEILPTIHTMNNSYNMDVCSLRGANVTTILRSARCSSVRAYSRVLVEAISAKVELSCQTNTISTVGVVRQRLQDELCTAFQMRSVQRKGRSVQGSKIGRWQKISIGFCTKIRILCLQGSSRDPTCHLPMLTLPTTGS